MSFTFIHTADWQIGKPFAGFDAETAAALGSARLAGIDRIADAATKAGAKHVLVAGDVFDSETASSRTVRQLISTLAANAGQTWHLLPGNHDPVRAGSVWGEVVGAGPPPNVRLHLASVPVAIAPGVTLLPAPLTQASTSIDPTAWMDLAVSPPGDLRIGLAHGSVQGNFGGDGDAAVPIAPDRPKLARLDYLALGDWHGTIRIADRVWYSGTHETDRFPDNAPGHVLVVQLDGGAAKPAVQRVATSHFTWTKRTLRVSGLDDVIAFESDIERLGRAQKTTLIDLALTGSVPLAEYAAIVTRLARIEQLCHLRINADALLALAGGEDIAALGEGAVRQAAERLRVIADTGGVDAAVARRALTRLAEFAIRDARAR